MRNFCRTCLFAALITALLLGSAAAQLGQSIDRIIFQPSQKSVSFGIHIVDADSGKTQYAHNARRTMIPASNMKLITTAAALHYLGPDYVYQTTVGIDANTLIIVGSGDPLLGDKVTDATYARTDNWLFADIAEKLKRRSIEHITDIIIDTTVFDDQRVHPDWPIRELNKWYACEVSGLNYNANCVDITATNSGGRIVIGVEPKTEFLKIINQVTPISKGRGAVGCYRTENLNTVVVNGRCRKQQGPFTVAIERPAAFFAFLLAEYLHNQGLTVEGEVIERGVDPNTRMSILATYNTKLSDCLARCNKDSFGLAAESLLKTIAASQNRGKNGSWAAGQALLSTYMSRLGVPKDQFLIRDGSGLSRNNRLSPNAITTVLLHLYRSANWPMYRNSLGVGGQDGTIRKYFSEPPYEGNVLGKTGYINSVKSFSGFCTTDGKNYLFSIIANNANGKTRPAINQIAKAIIDHAP